MHSIIEIAISFIPKIRRKPLDLTWLRMRDSHAVYLAQNHHFNMYSSICKCDKNCCINNLCWQTDLRHSAIERIWDDTASWCEIQQAHSTPNYMIDTFSHKIQLRNKKTPSKKYIGIWHRNKNECICVLMYTVQCSNFVHFILCSFTEFSLDFISFFFLVQLFFFLISWYNNSSMMKIAHIHI